MNHPPPLIGSARVVLYTVIDSRHHPTGATKHFVGGELQGPVEALAICRYDNESYVYLFYCSADWQTITDTYHESVEEAQDQAEFEYRGVSATWLSPTKS